MDKFLFCLRFLLSLLILALANCMHPSEQLCNSNKPENFEMFLNKFLDDKQFAMSRTLYPLLNVSYAAGNLEGEASVTKTHSTREQDSKYPSFNEYMEKNGLVHEIKSMKEDAAHVMVFKPDTDWIYDLYYNNTKGCWVFTEIHDTSYD